MCSSDLRLRREYRTLTNLPDHPHVVKVIWADRMADAKQTPYIVFEYVEGLDVSDLIDAEALSLFWYIGLRFFLTYWLIFASAVRHGNGWPAFKGILASIIRKPAAYHKRWSIQKNRKVSIDYIRSIIHEGPLPNQTGLLKFRKFFTKK